MEVHVPLSKANHASGFIVRDGFQGLVPVQPKVPSVFVGQLHVHLFRLCDVPVHFLFLALPFVTEGILGPFHEPFENGDVGDSRLFRKFPEHGGLSVVVVGLDVSLW